MNRSVLIIVGIVVLIAGGVAYYVRSHQSVEGTAGTAPAPAPSAAEQPLAPAEEEHHSVPAAESSEAAPSSLADSDDAMRKSLEKTFGKAPVESFLIPKNIIRNLVATIASLDGEPVAMRLRPLAHVPGLPAVDGDDLTLSPQNYARYTPYVDALNKAGGQQIAAIYLRYYPLFQSAYEELGYKGRYFNDRLVKVIDHLLATPKADAPIKLIRPKVLYEFEDAALEERSWGQKILIRMGPENAAVVKAKLREIRAAVIAKAPAP